MTLRANAPLCQSCSMPMIRPEDHGTDVGGRPDEDYCRFCFREGMFTEPNLSMEAMIDHLVARASDQRVSREQAAELGRRVLPRLKRWRDTTP